ncbi:MAG: hypothetical protein ACLUOF_01685 [Ruminococcus sp.]
MESWLGELSCSAIRKLGKRENILYLRFFRGAPRQRLQRRSASQAQVSRLEKNAILQVQRSRR